MHIQHSTRIVHCVSAQFLGVTQKLTIKVFLGLIMHILEVIQTQDQKMYNIFVTEKYKKYWGLCSNVCNGQKFTPVEESNRIKEAHSNRWEEDIYDLRFMLLKSYCQAQVHGLPLECLISY